MVGWLDIHGGGFGDHDTLLDDVLCILALMTPYELFLFFDSISLVYSPRELHKQNIFLSEFCSTLYNLYTFLGEPSKLLTNWDQQTGLFTSGPMGSPCRSQCRLVGASVGDGEIGVGRLGVEAARG